MQIAKVMGTATAISKHPSLVGIKLLLVQVYQRDNVTPDGYPLLATDTHGAGMGDDVIISSDSEIRKEIDCADTTPLRWSVMGIKDS